MKGGGRYGQWAYKGFIFDFSKSFPPGNRLKRRLFKRPFQRHLHWICQISIGPLMIRVMSLCFLSVAPQIQPNPANGILEVREGEPATLGCKITKGSPMPEIKWTRKVRFKKI